MFITSLKLNRSMFILSAAIGFVLSVLPEVLIASNTSITVQLKSGFIRKIFLLSYILFCAQFLFAGNFSLNVRADS